MFRKLTLITALAATLAFPAVALAGPHGGHDGGHGGWHGGHGGWHGGGVVVRGGRRFWGGRWWPYGVGPCWRWNPYYGTWNWVCY